MEHSAKRRRHLATIVGCLMTMQAHISFAESPSKLSAEWWQLFLSLPATGNPFVDDTGPSCVFGQRGPVWFLVGGFGGTVTRECAIPEGVTLFFPLLNLVDVNVTNQSARELRGELDPCIDATTTLILEVDGQPVQPGAIKRVRSDVFAVTLPNDNLFGAPAGTYSPAVDDGFYVTLKPLDVGQHTIHFQAARGGCPFAPAPDPFELDVTYNLTVVPVTLR
jgi:hypothetical protein